MQGGENTTLAPKEIIEFAGEQWLVLEKRANQALILSVDVLENRRFNKNSNEWSNSEIRSYLNGEFINRFSAEERAKTEMFVGGGFGRPVSAVTMPPMSALTVLSS
jgi:hypothetical protein